MICSPEPVLSLRSPRGQALRKDKIRGTGHSAGHGLHLPDPAPDSRQHTLAALRWGHASCTSRESLDPMARPVMGLTVAPTAWEAAWVEIESWWDRARLRVTGHAWDQIQDLVPR